MINQDVSEAVTNHCQDHLFHNVKFVATQEDAELLTSLVWQGSKDEKKLEEGSSLLDQDEFVDICASMVKKAVSNKRQCFQVCGAMASDFV